MVKHLPTMQETQVGSLGREDPLEKEMAPHSSTIVWKIPWTEEPGRLQSMGSQRVGHNWSTSLSLSGSPEGFPCGSAGKESARNVGDLGLIPGLERSPGEGKGYPCQYSGLENSMDCIIHGIPKSWTWLRDFHFTFLSLYIPFTSWPSPDYSEANLMYHIFH